MREEKKAKLVLENGLEVEGLSFGAEKDISGEVVFNTGMVGYPESLTDPSYRGQMLVLTYPLVGNYGVPEKKTENGVIKNFESDRIQVQALIVDDYSFEYSHWDAKKSLSEWLKEEGIPAVYGIDTRQLTKVLRKKGVMLGKIVFGEEKEENADGNNIIQKLTKKIISRDAFFDPNKIDIVKEVAVKEPVVYNPVKNKKLKKVILIDCGVKNNIIHELLKRNIIVKRVPHEHDFSGEDFDGVVISNGPGDPKQCRTTIANVKKAIETGKPIFGICLGNQILALAAGGDTYKLKFGHRSQNQPCILSGTEKCFITTQNHGFAVEMKSLKGDWEEYFVNANDGTNEGIRHKAKPFIGVQFHPESTPGPYDTEFIFDEFVKRL